MTAQSAAPWPSRCACADPPCACCACAPAWPAASSPRSPSACRSTSSCPTARCSAAAPRRGRPARARDRAPDGALRAARAPPQDRHRRGLHGRRLEGRRGHRPRRAAHAVRRAHDDGRARGLAAAARLRRPPHPEHPAQLAARLAPQHRGALRPVQRPLRGLPRRDDELQLGDLRRGPAAAHAVLRGGPAAQGARDPRHGQGRPGHAGCSRSAPAGARSPSRRPAAGRTVTSVTLSKEQAALARRRVADAGFADTRRHPDPGLPRGRGRLRRRRQRRDDRGRRRGVLGDLLPHHRRAPRPGRHRGRPGDPHVARAAHGDEALLRLDPEAHLPRRAHPEPPGDERDDRRRARRCG